MTEVTAEVIESTMLEPIAVTVDIIPSPIDAIAPVTPPNMPEKKPRSSALPVVVVWHAACPGAPHPDTFDAEPNNSTSCVNWVIIRNRKYLATTDGNDTHPPCGSVDVVVWTADHVALSDECSITTPELLV
jgi:hypothetical protein